MDGKGNSDKGKWTVDDLDLPDIGNNARQAPDPYRSTASSGNGNRQKRPAGGAQATRRPSGSAGSSRTARSSSGSAGSSQISIRSSGNTGGFQTQRRPSGSTGSSQATRRSSGNTGGAQTARKTSGRSSSAENIPEEEYVRSYERDHEERASRASGSGESEKKQRSSKTGSHKTNKKKKSGADITRITASPLFIGGAAGLLLIIMVIIVSARSCSSNHKSAQNVVEELITAFVNGDENKMKDSYGISESDASDVQAELDAAQEYYGAHNAKKLEITNTGSLFSEGKYIYVYIVYDLVLENDQKYPCIGTYIVQNIEDKYYVLPPSKVTEDLSEKATAAYKKFMNTDTYKKYTMDYETFIKKNPGYEDKIAAKLL